MLIKPRIVCSGLHAHTPRTVHRACTLALASCLLPTETYTLTLNRAQSPSTRSPRRRQKGPFLTQTMKTPVWRSHT